jgi:hypothetical protein
MDNNASPKAEPALAGQRVVKVLQMACPAKPEPAFPSTWLAGPTQKQSPAFLVLTRVAGLELVRAGARSGP